MSSNPSPALAAFLSFIFPGLGQIYAGNIRRGLIWAIPMLIFIVAALFFVLGGSAAITSLLTTQKMLGVVVFEIAFFLYHVAAMIDAYDIARNERPLSYSHRRSGTGPIILAGLIALAILIHGLPAMILTVPSYNFISSVGGGGNVIPSFPARTPRPATPSPSVAPSPSDEPTESPEPGETPDATPSGGSGAPRTPAARVCPPAPDFSAWPMASDGRVNLLLVGSDSRSDDGVSGASLRTDSMMLMSIDIASCKAALFSFPRNMEQPGPNSRYPSWFHIPVTTLQDGHPVTTDYSGFLFGLWRDAASSPGRYPGSDGIGPECQAQFNCERGWGALAGAIQNMSGVPIDGLVSVNLKGFVDIVANLPEGGLWIDVPSPLYDENYFNSRQERMLIDFKRGCQFMNPEEVLAYARSRHQDSDYQRGRRQQYVIQQIRKQLDPLALLPHVPGLLNAAQANMFMSNISDTDIPNLAQVASRIDADRMYRYDFAPARLTQLGSMEGMSDKIVNIFNEPEPEPTTRPNAEPCPPR